MKKLYVLCFVTLLAVLFDIVFFHSGSVSAQANLRVSVTPVLAGTSNVSVPGTVVGFSCTTEEGHLRCFVASQY